MILHAEVEMEDGKKYLLQNGEWGYFNREFFDLLNDHLNEIEIRYNTLTPTGLVFKVRRRRIYKRNSRKIARRIFNVT